MAISNEAELREKLRKIRALFEGAATQGERDAAAAAIGRLQKTLGQTGPAWQYEPPRPPPPPRWEDIDPPIEMQVSLNDRWTRRLFGALCRRHGLQPYRYRRQRYTTVMIRVPRRLFDQVIWPEYMELRDALNEYLNEATERIIREEVFGDAEEASEQ